MKFNASKFVSILKKDISERINLPNQINEKDIKTLLEILELYPDIFNKYFSDLAKIVNLIIIQSGILKEIGARFVVQPVCDFLIEKDLTLLYKPSTYKRFVFTEIYDSLREQFPNFIPVRVHQKQDVDKKINVETREEYRTIIGNRLKLYVISHLYDGIYVFDGKVKCPKCVEEEFKINTNISRLSSLELHHATKKKEKSYTAPKLARIFEGSGFNPNFLEELVKEIEVERVILLCRNHHKLEHHKYFDYFKHLINWENLPKRFPQDIFSLPAELIGVLIRVSVNNFKKTKNLTKDLIYYSQYSILRFLKKKYLIQNSYGDYCHTCEEFNIKKYLPSFDFHHIKGSRFHENPYIRTKIKSINTLFIHSYSCSEIAKILEYESGGFICANCHNVIGYSSTHLKLLDEIYQNENLVDTILNDCKSVKNRFRLFQDIHSIKDPLERDTQTTDTCEKYLDAIYKISQRGEEITNNSLAQHLNLNSATVRGYLIEKESFYKNFFEIDIGRNRLKKYILTDQGKKYIELMHYFRDYYKNL